MIGIKKGESVIFYYSRVRYCRVVDMDVGAMDVI